MTPLPPELRCAACGARVTGHTMHFQCPACTGLLELAPAATAVRGSALRDLFDSRVSAWRNGTARAQSGVWRFGELVLDAATVVSQPEGNTPLIMSDAVGRYAGTANLQLKHEGHNPTGSFKDRGMTVAVTHARAMAATAVACASTGNTAASLAAYAARAGLPALVLLPAGQVSHAKLAQAAAYGARLVAVRGDFDTCLQLVREASQRLGIYLANSINPFRIAGQKTIVFELLQQRGWHAPDWIAVPAGNLGNTAAFGVALQEASALGLIDRVPRLLAAQAAGAAPFARSFAGDFRERHRVVPTTIATAIRIGDPASWDRAVTAIRATSGVVVSVADDDILAAKRAIDHAGIGCEPASAASVAAVRALRATNAIQEHHHVVAVLTGHLLKDASGGRSADVMEIDANLLAVEHALRQVDG